MVSWEALFLADRDAALQRVVHEPRSEALERRATDTVDIKPDHDLHQSVCHRLQNRGQRMVVIIPQKFDFQLFD